MLRSLPIVKSLLHGTPALPAQVLQLALHSSTTACTSFQYIVTVVTGNKRGAGCETPARIRLYGEHGQSPLLQIGDTEERVGFERASAARFELSVRKDLGVLRRVYVGKQQTSLTDLSRGWYLDEVRVTGPTGTTTTFPCHSWLGQSVTGVIHGDLERNLIPETEVPFNEAPPQAVAVRAGGMSIPHPDKVKEGLKGYSGHQFGYGGEDAYFLKHGKNSVFGMGIADGVWQWRLQGIDAGIFSQQLMASAKGMVSSGFSDVVRIMYHINRKVQAEGLLGSSTACLVSIDTNSGRLSVANLGDSGFCLLGTSQDRPEFHIKYRTLQQEHNFGYPYQLGHHASADPPDDALLATIQVQPGDVVVLGSDGLFDNVFDNDIRLLAEAALESQLSPYKLARILVGQAYENSNDKRLETPYANDASEHFDMVFNGGKQDDITVVVAYVECDQH